MKIRVSSIFLFGVLLFLTETPAQAELATVYLKDGKIMTVEFVGIDRANLLWKRSSSAQDVQATVRSEVDKVNFPTTEAWRNAEAARESGRIGEALKFYREVIADPAGNYFPFPGNFVSLSKERILQCYRLQLDASKIAEQAKVVREEFFHLPPELKRVEPETAAWTAIANEKWEQALEALAESETSGPEAFFLQGRALEALGRKEEAVSAYAGTYVLNFGGVSNLTREALRRSSKLVFEIGDPARTAQLQAQVKLYRDLYGKGSLWEGAPEQLASLAEAEIKPLGEAENEMTKPGASGSTGGTVVTESATVAALPPSEEREFLLVEELPERAFLIGKKEEAPTLAGGATMDGESFRFDGTGGHFVLKPADLSPLFMQIRLFLEAEEPNGIIANARDGKDGGFSLYLKDGNLLMDWAPKKKKASTANLGKVEIGQPQRIEIIFRTVGTRETYIGETRKDDEVEKGGLKLGREATIKIGDADELLSKAELPPFKGVIHHFSFASAKDGSTAQEKTRERFGKNVRLLPPPPEAEGEAAKEEAPAE